MKLKKLIIIVNVLVLLVFCLKDIVYTYSPMYSDDFLQDTPATQEIKQEIKEEKNSKKKNEKSLNKNPNKINSKKINPSKTQQEKKHIYNYLNNEIESQQIEKIDQTPKVIKNYLLLEITTLDPQGKNILSNIKIDINNTTLEQKNRSKFTFYPLKAGDITINIIPLEQYLQKIVIKSNIETYTRLIIKIPPSYFIVKFFLFDLFSKLNPDKLNYEIYLNNTPFKGYTIENNSILIPIYTEKQSEIVLETLNQQEIDNLLKIKSLVSQINIEFKNNNTYKEETIFTKITSAIIKNTFPQYKRIIILENKLPNPYLYPLALTLLLAILSFLLLYLLKEIKSFRFQDFQYSISPNYSRSSIFEKVKTKFSDFYLLNPIPTFVSQLRNFLNFLQPNLKSVQKIEKISLNTIDHNVNTSLSTTNNPKVSDYILLERIGTGATSIVYKAQNVKTKSIVALKLIHKHLFSEAWFQERIKNEIEINKYLTHPNIVKLIDYDLEGEQPFLAFEFVQGKSLSKILQEKKRIPLNEALDIWIQTLEALDYAHQKGIIHRDLKPDNILLKEDKTVKITDFGISKRIDRTLNLTQDFVGTPWYMSPEQIKNQKIDNRSDIYSLGVIVYQMLTGKLPFETSENIYAVFKAHMFDNPVSTNIISESSYIPPDIEKIIRKMIEKDPKKRYQYCYEIIQDLTPYLLTYK